MGKDWELSPDNFDVIKESVAQDDSWKATFDSNASGDKYVVTKRTQVFVDHLAITIPTSHWYPKGTKLNCEFVDTSEVQGLVGEQTMLFIRGKNQMVLLKDVKLQ